MPSDARLCRTCGDPLWPSLVARREHQCRVCSGYYTRSKRGQKAKQRLTFTDAALVAELRKRSEWTSCGSMTLLNLFAAAADRLEQLTQAEKGQAA